MYPDIPYVVEDYAINYTFHGWETFIKVIIEHEQPKVLLINAISNPREYAITDLLSSLQSIAKENHVLILAEINISRDVEVRKDKHPKPKDVMCSWKARKYVDQFVFVYREEYYQPDSEGKIKNVEVYSSNYSRVNLPFNPQKYSV